MLPHLNKLYIIGTFVRRGTSGFFQLQTRLISTRVHMATSASEHHNFSLSQARVCPTKSRSTPSGCRGCRRPRRSWATANPSQTRRGNSLYTPFRSTMQKASAPIGTWKCNFSPYDRPTNQLDKRPSDWRVHLNNRPHLSLITFLTPSHTPILGPSSPFTCSMGSHRRVVWTFVSHLILLASFSFIILMEIFYFFYSNYTFYTQKKDN